MKTLVLSAIVSLSLAQGAIAVGTVFLEDDFNDGTLNTTIWKTTGKTVQEHDGVADLRMDETDNGGNLSTEFTPKNKIKVEVKHMMHAGGDNFFPNFLFSATDSAGDFSVQWVKSNYDGDYCNNSSWFNKIRFGSTNLIGTTSSCTHAVFSNLTSSDYYDKWVTSIIEYDVTTGKITLDANNDGVVDATATMNTGKRFPIKKITASAFGWWTGHWHKIDYIKLTDLETTTTTLKAIPSSLDGFNIHDVVAEGSGNATVFYLLISKLSSSGALYADPDGSKFYEQDIYIAKLNNNAFTLGASLGKLHFAYGTLSVESDLIRVFFNHKTTNSSYAMAGKLNIVDKTDLHVINQSVLFDNANWGWYPKFLGSDVEHLSYAGYYRVKNASSIGSVDPEIMVNESANNAATHSQGIISSTRMYSTYSGMGVRTDGGNAQIVTAMFDRICITTDCKIVDDTPKGTADLEFIGLKSTYAVGEMLKVQLKTALNVTSRYNRVDLWVAIQLPDGTLLFITSSPFNRFSMQPQLFKASLERTDTTWDILQLEIPRNMGGDYTFYALYVQEAKNPLTDGFVILRSNLAKASTVLQNR